MTARRNRWRAVVVAAFLALPLAGAGCGGPERTVVVNRMVSRDQAMSDLDRALAAGAISTSEYLEERQKLQAKQ